MALRPRRRGFGDESAQGPAIPGFTVLDVLGGDGSAVVHLARQDELDRLVALKVIQRQVHDPRVWREFDREMRAVAGLFEHPNVIAIYTTGRTATGEPFVVTEYADRGSLAHVLANQGPLALHEAVTVGLGVADALAAAHAVGIIHGDVKPGSVLLTSSGGVKLADFGIARLLSGTAATATGTIAFTPEHAAPEVIRGEAAGAPADVYGLASTIVAALTGRSRVSTMGTGESRAAPSTKSLPPDVRALPATVPPRLRAALTTVLSTDVQRRPRLVLLRLALNEAAREPAVAAVPTVAGEAITPAPAVLDIRRSRHRGRMAAPVVIAAALLALLVGMVIAVTRRDGRSTPAITAAATVAPARPGPVSGTPTTAAPVNVPPTTIPSVTAAPTMPAATTVGPATEAPTSTAAAAPTIAPPVAPTDAAAAPRADRARLAESFLRTYYSTVAARDYGRAWSMLTPEFQATTAGGYDDYTSFWDTVDGIEIRRVEVSPAPGNSTWPIVAILSMRYTLGGRVVDESDQLTLEPDATGAPRIAAYRVIGGT